MIPIGGNTSLHLQSRVLGEPNSVGERERVWVDVATVEGFLDYQAGSYIDGDSKSKLADTTHVFIGDYKELPEVSEVNSRARLGTDVYNILMIDNPMGLNYHLEFYLQNLGVKSDS